MAVYVQLLLAIILVCVFSSSNSLPTPQQQWYLSRQPRYNYGQTYVRPSFGRNTYQNSSPYGSSSYSASRNPSSYVAKSYDNHRFGSTNDRTRNVRLPSTYPFLNGERRVRIPSRNNIPTSAGTLSQFGITPPSGMTNPPIGEYVIVINENQKPTWIKLNRPMPATSAFTPVLSPLNFEG